MVRDGSETGSTRVFGYPRYPQVRQMNKTVNGVGVLRLNLKQNKLKKRSHVYKLAKFLS